MKFETPSAFKLALVVTPCKVDRGRIVFGGLSMDGERFIVTGYAYRMHGSYRAAYREAKRLAASYPKYKFNILVVREPDPKSVQNEQDKKDG